VVADQLRKASKDCEIAFSFLETDYGFRKSSVSSDNTSFAVRFASDLVGIEISYAIRGGLIVWICLLDAGAWPTRPGRITSAADIRCFDLDDVQAVAEGQPPEVDDSIYAIPDQRILHARAESLRAYGDSLLRVISFWCHSCERVSWSG
jgi:hypothetical protein